MHGVDYYQVLGVSQGASVAQIKASYKVLAKKFHPDLNGDAKKMARLNEAYRVLSDPQARHQYDQTIHIPRTTARRHYDTSDGYVYTPHIRTQSKPRPHPRPQATRSSPRKNKSSISKWLWATTFAVILSMLLGMSLHGPTKDGAGTTLGLTPTANTQQQATPSNTLNDIPPSTNQNYTDPTLQDNNSSTNTNSAQQACSQYRKRSRSYTNCMNRGTNCNTDSYAYFSC